MKKFISALTLSSTLTLPVILSGCQTEIIPLREHVENLSKLPMANEKSISTNYAIVLRLMKYDCSPIIVQDGLRGRYLVKVRNEQNRIIYVDVKNNFFYDNPFDCLNRVYYTSK